MKQIMIVIFIIILGGCSHNKQEAERLNKTPLVYVSHSFLMDATRFLVGKHVDIKRICVNNPAHCNPSVEIIDGIQKADLIILNGAGYELWQKSVSLPYSRILNTGSGFKKEWINIDSKVSHSHGNEVHTHQSSNPYFWLNNKLAVKQVFQISKRLEIILPDQKQEIRANFNAYRDSINLIHKNWQKIFESNQLTVVCNDTKLHYLLLSHQIKFQITPDLNRDSTSFLELTSDSTKDGAFYIDIGEQYNSKTYVQRMKQNCSRLSERLAISPEHY